MPNVTWDSIGNTGQCSDIFVLNGIEDIYMTGTEPNITSEERAANTKSIIQNITDVESLQVYLFLAIKATIWCTSKGYFV